MYVCRYSCMYTHNYIYIYREREMLCCLLVLPLWEPCIARSLHTWKRNTKREKKAHMCPLFQFESKFGSKPRRMNNNQLTTHKRTQKATQRYTCVGCLHENEVKQDTDTRCKICVCEMGDAKQKPETVSQTIPAGRFPNQPMCIYIYIYILFFQKHSLTHFTTPQVRPSSRALWHNSLLLHSVFRKGKERSL